MIMSIGMLYRENTQSQDSPQKRQGEVLISTRSELQLGVAEICLPF